MVLLYQTGITLNKEVPEKIMAYDLAIGIVEKISKDKKEDLNTLSYWRNLADWRSPRNLDADAVNYAKVGILPPDIKKTMNYPDKHGIEGSDLVVNQSDYGGYVDVALVGAAVGAVGSVIGRAIGYSIPKNERKKELAKDKYKNLSKPAQWVMPDPDLETPPNDELIEEKL